MTTLSSVQVCPVVPKYRHSNISEEPHSEVLQDSVHHLCGSRTAASISLHVRLEM